MPRSDEETYPRRGPSGVAIFALLIGLAALVLAVLAYNRSGKNLNQDLRSQLEQQINQARLDAARAEAATRLAVILGRRQSSPQYSSFENDVEGVRQDLEQAYRNAGADTTAGWRSLNTGFQNLEQQIRQGSADAIATLQSLLADLRQKI